ncbi:MAG TPA: patatin-like phospholipase family protein [Micropepsaceae bacterium]|nr:patatin-like phospholipase family protein [Micropepsaceae bacterium]
MRATKPESRNRRTPHAHTVRIVLPLLAALFATSCGTRTWNSPIPPSGINDRYDFYHRLNRGNAQDVFVVLAFSGGGTRAAAFSYGALRALREIPITWRGRTTTLLDEVDVISSVSGGSYTAAYYGLFGERIFDDFESDFLKRDVESSLIYRLANPVNLISITGSEFNRGDLSAQWLDENLFQGKTFSDMSRNGNPYVIINASDINTGLTFSFIQQQFDFLCSDINTYPVANAVMASSAVPGVFAPIAVRNFETACAQRTDSWVAVSGTTRDTYSRRHQVSRGLRRYFEPARMPVVRLLDGGITDNLGVRGSMMSPVAHYGNVEDMAGAFTPSELAAVRHVLVIVVNAQVYNEYSWSIAGADPSIIEMIEASFNASIDILSTETISLAKAGFMMWEQTANARRAPDAPRVRVHFAAITFDDIVDPAERERFNAMPTSLSLPPQDVDDLAAMSAQLVKALPEVRSFVGALQAEEEVGGR